MTKRYYIKIELTEDEYKRIVDEARRRGYMLPKDLVREIVLEYLEHGAVAQQPGAIVDERKIAEMISRRVERAIADLINPFTAKIDEIQRRLADLVEAMEAGHKPAQERAETGRSDYRSYSEQRRGHWRSGEDAGQTGAIERLKQQKVVFEADVSWMRAPDRFFRKLEREGAVVIEAGGERIAVDRDFWREFQQALSETGIRDPEEAAGLIEAMLGVKAGELFKKLVKSGLVYYNDEAGSWEIAFNSA